jgi:hypothetical protein
VIRSLKDLLPPLGPLLVPPLICLCLCLACGSTPRQAEIPQPGALKPASTVEAMLRDVARPRERLDRKLLQGAWSRFRSSGRRAQPLGGDHPVLIVRSAPELALGDLVFVGSIEVAKGAGREGFGWKTATTHLKGRAQEYGADLVLIVKAQRDPVGKGLRRVLAATYRYQSRTKQ